MKTVKQPPLFRADGTAQRTAKVDASTMTLSSADMLEALAKAPIKVDMAQGTTDAKGDTAGEKKGGPLSRLGDNGKLLAIAGFALLWFLLFSIITIKRLKK